jgi:hypothetical protein
MFSTAEGAEDAENVSANSFAAPQRTPDDGVVNIME